MTTTKQQLLDHYRAFRAWREQTTFPTPALADHAETVENDLRRMPDLDPVVNSVSLALCKDNIAKFVENYAASRAQQTSH